jgi:ketosteroid isomerase-like protein
MTESHPNIELINAFFKAYATNNVEAIQNIFADDIKWHIPGTHPLSGTKLGVNAVLEYFEKLNKGRFMAEPIVMGVNDNFVIDCHRNLSNIEGEEHFNNMSCLLWKIDNQKIVEVHNFPQNQQIVDLFFSKLYK